MIQGKRFLLCQVFDCALWEWRTGNHVTSNVYQARIQNAFQRYKKDFDAMKSEGIDLKRFLGVGKK